MQSNADRIRTTHVGALAPIQQEPPSDGAAEEQLLESVRSIVRLQRQVGIDFVNEGELTKAGNWVNYVTGRLEGFVPRAGNSAAVLLKQSADWKEFPGFYREALGGGTLFTTTREAPSNIRSMDNVCCGPLRYSGQSALAQEIDLLRSALGDADPSTAFLTSTAPASLEPGRPNEYYASDEQYVFALAEALRTEYETIVDAGFSVQVDDAWLAALWDRIGVGMGLPAYKRYCMMRVEALNHALRNIPADRVRYHLCWGSWHGPHAHDIPLADIVDVMLAVNAQTYLFEAANVRHEHEFTVWENVKLPDDKILAPGVVTHSTPLLEHPELVSTRIQRFARLVGRERVVASTDCGLGLRCHPEIAWAKLKVLVEGARRASTALWPRS